MFEGFAESKQRPSIVPEMFGIQNFAYNGLSQASVLDHLEPFFGALFLGVRVPAVRGAFLGLYNVRKMNLRVLLVLAAVPCVFLGALQMEVLASSAVVLFSFWCVWGFQVSFRDLRCRSPCSAARFGQSREQPEKGA